MAVARADDSGRASGFSGDRWIYLFVGLGCALPVVLTPYVPGLDVPWHVLFIDVFHRHDASLVERDFLGYLEVVGGQSSYLLFYRLADIIAYAVGPVRAVQVLTFVYVAAFVMASRRLMAAFGRDTSLAIVAAPAAYGLSVLFGFLPFAFNYPLIMWLWAVLAELKSQRPGPRLAAIAPITLCIAVGHPLAAALAAVGAVIILATRRAPVKLAAAAAFLLVVGLTPTLWALLNMGAAPADHLPDVAQRMSFAGRLLAQPQQGLAESLLAIPSRTFAFLSPVLAVAMFIIGLGAVGYSRWRARRDRVDGGLCGWLIVGCLVVIYLATPYHVEFPRTMFAAQPRVLPLLWIALVLALAPRPRTEANPVRWVASAAAVLAIGAITAGHFVPVVGDASNFNAVVERSEEGARTLMLIEQEPVTDDRLPAGPYRHYGAYLMVEKGGLVSNVPNWAEDQPWIPVSMTHPGPDAPPPGQPRAFTWAKHGAGWDQFLILDGDPLRRFAYFDDRGRDVELVVTSGRWRLYRRR